MCPASSVLRRIPAAQYGGLFQVIEVSSAGYKRLDDRPYLRERLIEPLQSEGGGSNHRPPWLLQGRKVRHVKGEGLKERSAANEGGPYVALDTLQSPAKPAAGVAAIAIHTRRMSGERARGLAVVALMLFTEIAALAQY